MKAPLNNIMLFSSVDGPGNRSAVFLQGCNIDCKYCHNPETRKLCKRCGLCVKKCPTGAITQREDGEIEFDLSKCVKCDACIQTCPYDSTPRILNLSPEEIYEVVSKQIPFISGVTVSGGECMLQTEFIKEFFTLAKKDGLNTLIDSNGTIPFWEYPDLMEVTDGVMLDIKAFDEAAHINVTGHTNKVVIANAKYLAEIGKLDEVRMVVVQDLYDAVQSARGIIEMLSQYENAHKIRIKIISYRPMGVREQYAHYEVPSEELLEQIADMYRTHGFESVIII